MVDLQSLLTYLTLISVPIGVFYHILTLRNQTKTRHMQIIQGVESKIKISNFDYDFLEAPWENYEDFWDKHGRARVPSGKRLSKPRKLLENSQSYT